MQLTGILPVNKALGLRSTHCVEVVKHILGRGTRVGHGGTLDSTASGLLLILLGSATRLSDFVMDMPKCYETVVQFGSETDTDDAEGRVLCERDFSFVSDAAIDSALCGFMGWRMQRPPRVSAVHVDGVRAHKLARRGEDVEIAPKPVYFASIERLDRLDVNGRAAFRVRCRKGTYIRSFARDLGSVLGCGAHVQELKRVSSGPFSAADSRTSEEIEGMDASGLAACVLPPEAAFGACSSYLAGASVSKRLMNGLDVEISQLRRCGFGKYSSSSDGVAVRAEGFLSLCRAKVSGGTLELAPSVNISDGSNL